GCLALFADAEAARRGLQRGLALRALGGELRGRRARQRALTHQTHRAGRAQLALARVLVGLAVAVVVLAVAGLGLRADRTRAQDPPADAGQRARLTQAVARPALLADAEAFVVLAVAVVVERVADLVGRLHAADAVERQHAVDGAYEAAGPALADARAAR